MGRIVIGMSFSSLPKYFKTTSSIRQGPQMWKYKAQQDTVYDLKKQAV